MFVGGMHTTRSKIYKLEKTCKLTNKPQQQQQPRRSKR